jgi:dienelactone hydrolase
MMTDIPAHFAAGWRAAIARRVDFAVAVIAVATIGLALWQLRSGTAGLQVSEARVHNIPVTVYRPAGMGPFPTVLVAHGFAGSQQLMQPYAVTLARNGYRAVTFDFPGHGRNPDPFVARIEDEARRVGVLLGALESVARYAAGLPDGDGRLALLGHSMAGDVLLRYAAAHKDQVIATVLVSPYLSKDAPVAEPRDLLFVYGALEPEMLHAGGRDAIAKVTGDAVEPGTTYGNPTDGTARRLVLADGAEHIGVLYGTGGLKAALEWLNQATGTGGDGYLEDRGRWLGYLYLGILVLAWPLFRLLPRAATAPMGAGLPWRRLLPVAIAPAILTPLILRVLPSDYLPILLGDYLALHFGVYGVITAIGVCLVGCCPGRQPGARVLWRGLLIGTLAASIYATLAIALPTDRFVTSFFPGAERLWLLLAIVPGTWAYFAADGWITRGPGAARGGGVFTKALFLLSLLLAVALNLSQLFFLIIIVPAILVFFLLYGLLGWLAYRQTWNPLVGALANGLSFAWAIAVTFPVVN